MVKDIDIRDFDYDLPEEKIPLHPLEARDECKLLVSSPSRHIYHRLFKELPGLMPPGALMVCNDTKVINARLLFHKDTGAAIELFLLEPLSPSDYALNFQTRDKCRWKCLVGNSKKWKDGNISLDITLPEGKILKLSARRVTIFEDGASEIEFSWEDAELTFGQILEIAGKIPIPPYLNRESEDSDLRDYQTIYAIREGSVAAPTAGLHFTPSVMENLAAHGVEIRKVTLHVGAGTFRPVKSDKIGEHNMHAEPFTISKDLITDLIEWKRNRRPIVAVGTTSVRTLESLPYVGRNLMEGKSEPYIVTQWDPYESSLGKPLNFDTLAALEAILRRMDQDGSEGITVSTSIMIAPGFEWRITDGMVTNFHQPKSTLLLLVSSFLGGDNWKEIYASALREEYRFLSYGDASLLLK